MFIDGVLQMNMLPPSSEQKKTFKMETAHVVTRNILWYFDKTTTFWKFNLLLQSIRLLGDYYMGLVIIRKINERPWDVVFTARGNKKIAKQITKKA